MAEYRIVKKAWIHAADENAVRAEANAFIATLSPPVALTPTTEPGWPDVPQSGIGVTGEDQPVADYTELVAEWMREKEDWRGNDDLIDRTVAALSAKSGDVGAVIDEWTVDELRQSVRATIDAPGSGHNVMARTWGISAAKLSEFLSGKRGAEPAIIEPMGYRWALVSVNDYPRREDTAAAAGLIDADWAGDWQYDVPSERRRALNTSKGDE